MMPGLFEWQKDIAARRVGVERPVDGRVRRLI